MSGFAWLPSFCLSTPVFTYPPTQPPAFVSNHPCYYLWPFLSTSCVYVSPSSSVIHIHLSVKLMHFCVLFYTEVHSSQRSWEWENTNIWNSAIFCFTWKTERVQNCLDSPFCDVHQGVLNIFWRMLFQLILSLDSVGHRKTKANVWGLFKKFVENVLWKSYTWISVFSLMPKYTCSNSV